MKRLLAIAAVIAIIQLPYVGAQSSDTAPDILENVGLDQKLGSQVPLDLEFLDADGRKVTLGQFFGEKPVVLTLVYYECPMLCTLILNGTVRALRAMDFSAGEEFNVVTVSINPEETPALATTKKTQYLETYRRDGAENGWYFLTGTEDKIRPLADAVGFRYAYDPESGEYVHASGIMVLTPEGKVARYFYGVEYSPRDIRLGLVEASSNQIGSPVDQVLLFCYHYNPLTGKYTIAILSILRVAGVLTILGLGLLLLVLLKKDRGREAQASA